MEVIEQIEQVSLKPSVATIGFFDGVHRGHQFLFKQIKQLAETENLSAMAITFAEHPRRVMHQAFQPQLLSTQEEKRKLLTQQPLDYLVLLHFTLEMSRLTAREFMQHVLRDQLNVKVLVIGYDHRFGHNRAEGFDDYVRYGKELGIQVVHSEAYSIEGAKVSSSAIRALVKEGKMEHVMQCTGSHYHVKGTIVDGHKVGRKLGFPTANIRVDDAFKLMPAEGVYAVWVLLDGQRYKGMLNIGRRPTLDNGNDCSVEVYVLGFSGDVYQHTIEVEFVSRLRDEQYFRSVEELTAQLRKDAQAVESLLFLR
ncbi:MAG: bifunctional riboflavin kinase/FAD synthetase [Bacteroidaceae bacterium]|nr:bifunctional riboflavin kinase/FAD synthetase [Bacteroidaceae bacterium]